MSKVKLNNRQVKDCITAVKNSEDLSDTKKNTIITIMRQFQWDKEEGVFTDGMVTQLIFDVAMELTYHKVGLSDGEIANKLLDIIHNMDKRKYYATDDGRIQSSDFGK